MNRIVIKSKVGRDGVLDVKIPLGTAEAERDVQVTVEPLASRPMTQEEWKAGVFATAGKWQGDLSRPEQGNPEVRDAFP
jgi:hypothetical protein